MNEFEAWLEERLARLSTHGLLRKLVITKGKIDFTSNDYLGLARSKELSQCIEREILREQDQKDDVISPRPKNGSTGSRLLSGNSAYAVALENKLSKIFQSEAALIYNSGYAANTGVLSAIPQKGDTILYDELVHASLKDGARLSLATRHSFRHNDLEDLSLKIKKSEGRVFVVVESLYSMDGDACPLEQLVNLCTAQNALLIVDEAHSTGVMGDGGAGMSVEKKVHSKISIRIYTFGKGIGAHGACVTGSKHLIDYLINFSRPFIYTTALPVHSLASISCSFDYLAAHPELQEVLMKNIYHYLARIRQISGIRRTESESAIQTIIVPGNTEVKNLTANLQQKGFDVRPILSPTIRDGTERIRICLHAFNTLSEIDQLADELSLHFA